VEDAIGDGVQGLVIIFNCDNRGGSRACALQLQRAAHHLIRRRFLRKLMLRVCAAFDCAGSAEARGVHGWRGGIAALFAAIATMSFCFVGYLAALGADNVNWSKCYD
jgi:hypothetical protein